jgi:hypothetical protein
VQKSLGWNTTAVQAGASELVFLNKCNGLAQLSRAKCSRIAAASATKNYNVKVVVSHEFLPLKVHDHSKVYYLKRR